LSQIRGKGEGGGYAHVSMAEARRQKVPVDHGHGLSAAERDGLPFYIGSYTGGVLRLVDRRLAEGSREAMSAGTGSRSAVLLR
jgi:hypothetical protein